MNEFDAKENRFGSWLTPLGDDEAPGGPDLEYDNDFLALVQTAAGKPESRQGAHQNSPAPTAASKTSGQRADFHRLVIFKSLSFFPIMRRGPGS